MVSQPAWLPPRPAWLPPPPWEWELGRQVDKPGCTAADETLVVKGHLEGVARGLWGSGVLQHDIARMDRAIAGAQAMGDQGVARALAAIKAALPGVRNPAQAEVVLRQTEDVIPRVGELAKRCGAQLVAQRIPQPGG